MEQDKTTGQLVDILGAELTLRDDDLVAGVVIVAKVIEGDGTVRLSQCWSEGMSWIERVGMLHTARVTEDESTTLE